MLPQYIQQNLATTAVVTGALDATLVGASSAATGQVVVQGQEASPLAGAAATGTATGQVVVQGQENTTLAGATAVGTGVLPIAGAANDNLAGATSTATGAVVVQGQEASTLAGATSAATGAVPIAGAAADTLAGATTAAAGAVIIQGQEASTLAGATATATGAAVVQGAATDTLAGATSSATGVIPIAGAAMDTLANATSSAAGAVVVKGALGKTLDGATLVANDSTGATGTLNKTLGDATATGVATTFTYYGHRPIAAIRRSAPSLEIIVPAIATTVAPRRAVAGVLVGPDSSIQGTGRPTPAITGGSIEAILQAGDIVPYVNTPLIIPITLTYNGVAFAPTSLTLVVIDPRGVRAQYTLTSPEMQNPATGSYYVELIPTVANRNGLNWKYSWSAVKADGRTFYDKGTLDVRERDVV